MKNKLSKNIVDTYNPEKITRYSIRKASFGATSVAIAAFFMYLGQGTAAASDTNIQDQIKIILLRILKKKLLKKQLSNPKQILWIKQS